MAPQCQAWLPSCGATTTTTSPHTVTDRPRLLLQHTTTSTFTMADTDQHLVAEKMTSAIKLTGTLISAVYEYLWTIDDSVPVDLPKLIDALQAVGKALSALRKYSSDDPDLGASVLEKLNAPNGPVVECAAELGRLCGKMAIGTGDGGLRAIVEKGHVASYIEQLGKHQQVFALALQVLQDHGYVCASCIQSMG